MKNLIARFVREEEGQDLIEYALVATFVSLVASVGATAARHLAGQLVQHGVDQRRRDGRLGQLVAGDGPGRARTSVVSPGPNPSTCHRDALPST